MKYILASICCAAIFHSCLVAPLPSKEKIRPAGNGSVTAKGDLGKRLEKSRALLYAATAKPDMIFEQDSVEGISGRVGDALLGTVLMGETDGSGTRAADRIYTVVRARLNPSGYLGEIRQGEADERRLAGHARLIRALCEYYRTTGEGTALDMAVTITDSLYMPLLSLLDDYPDSSVARLNIYFPSDSLAVDAVKEEVSGLRESNEAVRVGDWILSPRYGDIFSAIDPVAQLYGYRSTDNIREILERLIKLFNDELEDYPGRGTYPYLSAIRGMLRYGKASGENGYVQDAERAWTGFKETALTDMYGSGRTTPEGFGIVCPEDASQAYIAAFCLWAETGDGQYLQDAERIYYNSIAPSQVADGGFTCLVSDTLDGKLSRYTGKAYGGTVPWVEALPFAASGSYYLRDNKVLIPMYGESELSIEDKGVRIVQSTSYPLDSVVRIEIAEAPPRGVGLYLYFPTYMTAKSLKRNGSETVTGTLGKSGLLEMREVYRKGDVLEFKFAFEPRWLEAIAGNDDGDLYKAADGPVLLGYRNEEMLWLQRGVPLRDNHHGAYIFDPEHSFTPDSLTGQIMVSPIKTNESFPMPLLEPVFSPMADYGEKDNLPEYILFRIGKD